MSQAPLSSKLFNSTIAMTMVFFSINFTIIAQTLGDPVVSSPQYCANTSIDISFTVTNGQGNGGGNGNGSDNSDKTFSSNTLYTLQLTDPNGTYSYTFPTIPTPVNAPANTSGASATISVSLLLPADVPYSTTYQIRVNSENPSPAGNKEGVSTYFEILPILKNNTISADQSGCNPYTAQVLTGSLPTGGDNTYTYIWESSTTGPNTGFNVASGINDQRNYDPGSLTQTTWFRRNVISGSCSNTSSSVEINITNDNIWTGATNTDWNNASNWGCNMVPFTYTNVIIPAGLSNYPILSNGTAGTANDIIIESGASLEVNFNTLNIYGSISNNGTFDAQMGSIEMKGTTSQDIPAGTFLNDQVENLSINNPAGVSLLGSLGVSGTFSALQGTFDTGNFFTLLSDATQTALIDGSGSGQINGTVTMQRYLDSSFGYKYFSSPFSNSVVGDFSTYVDLNATFPQSYRYNENREDSQNQDATGWEAYTSSAASLNVMEGYALNFGANTTPITIELTGNINNGQQSISLTNNNGKYTKGFNLVGNPYPSPIDWDAAGWTKTNIDDGIYFFTASGSDQYSGTYTSYVNGISSGSGASSIIPSMQGFFVHVSDQANYPVSASLGVTNAVRLNDFSQGFYKASESEKKEKKSLIKLEAGFANSKLKDATVIYFSNYAHTSFEKDKDALKLMNTNINVPNIYSLSPDKKKLSINGMTNPGNEDLQRIPLGINAEKEGWITISMTQKSGVTANYIYLLDRKKRTGQDLKKDPNFKFHLEAGDYESRFEIIFSRTRITDPAMAFNDLLSVHNEKGHLEVNINLKQEEKGLLRVNSTSGQLLYASEVSGKKKIEINGIKSSGVYIISLKTAAQNYSKKVLIKD